MEPTVVDTNVAQDKSLFTESAITVATALGGPLAGAFLFSMNYKTLGRPDAARRSLFIGVGGLVVFFAVLFALPDHLVDAVPNAFYAALWGALAYAFVHKYQQEHIKAHLASGGCKGSGWVVFGISIAGLILTLLMVVPFVLFTPAPASFEGEVVTLERTQGSVYFDGAATPDQALLLGRFLEELHYFSPGDIRAAKLEERHGSYKVILEIDKRFWDEPSLSEWLDALIRDLERHYEAAVQVTTISYRLDGKREEKVFMKLPRGEET